MLKLQSIKIPTILMTAIILFSYTCLERPSERIRTGEDADRGYILITEVHWGGSVDNNGVYYPDDDYIKLQNQELRPFDLSNWYILIRRGDYVLDVVTIPEGSYIEQADEIRHNGIDGVFTLVNNIDHAFGPISGKPYAVGVNPRLILPNSDFHLSLMTWQNNRIDDWGSRDGGPIFGGNISYTINPLTGIATVLETRSLEKNCEGFSEDAGGFASWFTFIGGPNETCGGKGIFYPCNMNINPDYAQRTLSAYGIPNQERPYDDCDEFFM